MSNFLVALFWSALVIGSLIVFIVAWYILGSVVVEAFIRQPWYFVAFCGWVVSSLGLVLFVTKNMEDK